VNSRVAMDLGGIKCSKERGFTLSEVSLAVGVIAFGLVGIMAILPYGLTAQKDNREETIIRYEVQYWKEVLLAGGRDFNEMDRVESVEVREGGVSTLLPNIGNRTWPQDVCGWLSMPDANGSDPFAGQYALVKAMNGPLFDRHYGANASRIRSDNNITIKERRDVSLGYILRVQTGLGPDRSKGAITFYWPLFADIQQAVYADKDLIREVVRASLTGGTAPKSNMPLPRMKSKTFEFRTDLEPQLVAGLDAKSERIMKCFNSPLPGGVILESQLSAQVLYSQQSESSIPTGIDLGFLPTGILREDLVGRYFETTENINPYIITGWSGSAPKLREILLDEKAEDDALEVVSGHFTVRLRQNISTPWKDVMEGHRDDQNRSLFRHYNRFSGEGAYEVLLRQYDSNYPDPKPDFYFYQKRQ